MLTDAEIASLKEPAIEMSAAAQRELAKLAAGAKADVSKPRKDRGSDD